MQIVIIGGGVIGLSIAFELALFHPDWQITIVERGEIGRGASWSAAGMLAPTAEGLTGTLAQLGYASRDLYPQWIDRVQKRAGISCGYWCCGIIQPSGDRSHPQYVSGSELARYQAGLAIESALWIPDDSQVDNRQLVLALELANRSLGVVMRQGVAVHSLTIRQHQVVGVETSAGTISADRYILTTGAWTAELLPQPISPRKGQMLSVFDPDRSLGRVIYGAGIYLVPRQDGRIIVGATVEDCGFQGGNTAWGINYLLSGAIQLYPAIAHMKITETWWGFRPYAPQEELILGASAYPNLLLALGHYRNGILLAPITAQKISQHLRDSL
jgi:glycine oxidase ThiO